MSAFSLRPYQQEASDAAVKFFRSKAKGNGIIVAPTGAGKSIIIADIARQLDGNIIVLQPSKELLEQNFGKLAKYGIVASIYSASLKQKKVGRITFATIGSVNNHMELFDEFAAVIIDECHLVNAAEGMYKKFIEKMPRKVLGLTATPYRLYTCQGIEFKGEFKPNGSYKEDQYFDENGFPKPGVELKNKCILKFLTRTKPRIFSSVLYSIGIDELLQQGYLANVRYFPMNVIDTSRVRMNSTGRDYDERSLYAENERCGLTVQLSQIVRRLLNPKDGKPRKGILVFTRFIEESEALCRAVPECRMLTGETPADERDRLITGFKAGEIKVLTNVGVLTTGFDYPELDTIVMARPTNSLAQYYQIVGREIRPFPGKDAWFVDLGGNVGRFGKVEHLKLYEPKAGMYAMWGWVSNSWKQLTNTYF
jgi:DNA repair protein RadD